MKFALKKNETKEFLLSEKKAAEENMKLLGPGEDYDKWFQQWKNCNEELEKMSLGYKLDKKLPWINTALNAVGFIGVPLFLGVLAWAKSESGELKEGDTFRQAVNAVVKPNKVDVDTTTK